MAWVLVYIMSTYFQLVYQLLMLFVKLFSCHFFCTTRVSTIAAFHYPDLPLPSRAQLVNDGAWQHTVKCTTSCSFP